MDIQLQLKRYLMAWTDPVPWVFDKSAKSVLDLGCGQGKVMDLIRKRVKVKKAIGVDLFESYLNEARKYKTHTKLIQADVRQINFKPKSFDVVLASHILEHLPKKDALELLAKIEKIARKQVIVATPIGKYHQEDLDDNEMQRHLSFFIPEEFEKRGYKTVRYGWRWLLGHDGLVEKARAEPAKKALYLFNLLLTPIYYLFQNSCDYSFVAHRRVD